MKIRLLPLKFAKKVVWSGSEDLAEKNDGFTFQDFFFKRDFKRFPNQHISFYEVEMTSSLECKMATPAGKARAESPAGAQRRGDWSRARKKASIWNGKPQAKKRSDRK